MSSWPQVKKPRLAPRSSGAVKRPGASTYSKEETSRAVHPGGNRSCSRGTIHHPEKRICTGRANLLLPSDGRSRNCKGVCSATEVCHKMNVLTWPEAREGQPQKSNLGQENSLRIRLGWSKSGNGPRRTGGYAALVPEHQLPPCIPPNDMNNLGKEEDVVVGD
ncbi:hypothetical protein pipiens_004907 [Culex pipiens pipiens]|uniref:Uncharacterized protein n=1 Tax=Culex pipiens pipiens TaxID=38569 RepID=A0ABD1CE58_CULPP